jgi:Pvc16 N-terminal domain/Carboxypeptidase regulatory-like domain
VAPLTVVPLNTMLADLDESLRNMLKRELGRHGFDGVEIVFDAPDKEWSASLSSPTVNLFLYDLREAVEVRPTDWWPDSENGRREVRPPLRVDASYAVTAWTRDVQDEHRLLSQVLAVFYAYPELPDEALFGTLADQMQQRYPLATRVAQARQDAKADFWTSVGGQYKASVDYIVTVSCESGTVLERGPEVRTQTVQLFDRDMGRGHMEELNRVGGVVTDAAGEPVRNAWLVLSGVGWAASDNDGRFLFHGVKSGTYTCMARGPDGSEAKVEHEVPGQKLDITLGGAAKKPAKSGGKSRSSS